MVVALLLSPAWSSTVNSSPRGRALGEHGYGSVTVHTSTYVKPTTRGMNHG